MLKQCAKIEITKDDRVYTLHLPDHCNLGECHDVLYDMKIYIVERIKEITEKEKKIQEKPPEVTSDEAPPQE